MLVDLNPNTILDIQMRRYDGEETIDFLLDQAQDLDKAVEELDEEIDDLRSTLDASKHSLDEMMNEFEDTLNSLCDDLEEGHKYSTEEIKELFKNVNTFYAETYTKMEG